MGGARRLLLLTALLSLAGVVFVALPAGAGVGLQHCQLVKGRLVASPGLTDVPTDQTITLATRVTGCSRAGGSAVFAAEIAAPQSTCAGLTASLLPTTATFAWANGKVSTVAMAFSSLPGSPNRLVFAGRVVSGAGTGDRVDGGLHLSATFSKIIKRSADHHDTATATTTVRQRQPLNGDGDCTASAPLATINLASFESVKFSSTGPSPTTTTSRPRAKGSEMPGTSTTSTTIAPAKTVKRPGLGKVPRRRLRPPVRRIASVNAVDATAKPKSGSFFDPESVLLLEGIGVAVVLLILLFLSSRRARRRRGAVRLFR